MAKLQDDLAHALPWMGSLPFGHQVQALRKSAHRSIAEIAAAAGIAHGYLSEVERCKRPAPTSTTAERIALALGLDGVTARGLVAVAEAERATRTADGRLPQNVQGLLHAIRLAAPRLSAEGIALLRARLEEICT
jgi:transcriptional regulator with XRE-family HTH domain